MIKTSIFKLQQRSRAELRGKTQICKWGTFPHFHICPTYKDAPNFHVFQIPWLPSLSFSAAICTKLRRKISWCFSSPRQNSITQLLQCHLCDSKPWQSSISPPDPFLIITAFFLSSGQITQLCSLSLVNCCYFLVKYRKILLLTVTFYNENRPYY